MKRYGLYWLRALTLGAGLNALVVIFLMNHRDWKFHQAAPIAIICVNCSFMADRIIFGRTKKAKVIPTITPTGTPHSCPVCNDYPCICDSWNT